VLGGLGILRLAPWLMKFLSTAGTAAMFMVGGGILTHNVRAPDFAIEATRLLGVLGAVFGMLADLVVGVIVGAIVLGVVKLMGKLRSRLAAGAENKPMEALTFSMSSRSPGKNVSGAESKTIVQIGKPAC
jgi:Protein of unknown function (DUF808)